MLTTSVSPSTLPPLELAGGKSAVSWEGGGEANRVQWHPPRCEEDGVKLTMLTSTAEGRDGAMAWGGGGSGASKVGSGRHSGGATARAAWGWRGEGAAENGSVARRLRWWWHRHQWRDRRGTDVGTTTRKLGGGGGAGTDAAGASPEARRKGGVAVQRELAVVGRLPRCWWAPSPFLDLLPFFGGIDVTLCSLGFSFGQKLARRLTGGGTEEAWTSFQGWRQGAAACVEVGRRRGAGAVEWRPRAATARPVVSELRGDEFQSKVARIPGESLAWWFIGPRQAIRTFDRPIEATTTTTNKSGEAAQGEGKTI
uniref:Uncharacterized protein n=1 Tax=Oryza punctata TaxID=4537 RepID=A0A0E0KZB3_ORYPU